MKGSEFMVGGLGLVANPEILNPKPKNLHLKAYILNPKHQAIPPKSCPKPETLDPK